MKKLVFYIIIVLVIGCISLYTQLRKANAELSITYANLKAYTMQIDTLYKSNRALFLTTQQLNTYNDTLIKKLKETKDNLKIKDKDLHSLQYIETLTTIKDTVVFTDTIFKENYYCDTIIKDTWYSIDFELKYPNTITVIPEIKSEQHIVASYKKETIKPPKKFFLFRLFQKKHKVLTIDIVEQNPYIDVKNQKYIEILE